MDELLIEDKKYISSKRAAQITGYAKDYVGQLCREGRVSARLVGRTWYVLESALADHRFKTPEKEQKGPVISRKESVVSMSSGWESPRYEAISAEELPALRRIEHVETEREVTKESPEAPAHLHEAWQAWFDHIANQPQKMEESTMVIEEGVQPDESKGKANEILDKSESIEEKKVITESREREKGGVKVLIRTIDNETSSSGRNRQHAEIEEGERASEEAESNQMERNRKSKEGNNPRQFRKEKAFLAPLRIAAGSLALIMALFAGLSTGHFDSLIASFKPANLLAGVSMYEK